MRNIATGLVLGTAGLVLVGWVVVTGTPRLVETRATGYRGLGMAVVADVNDANALARPTPSPSRRPTTSSRCRPRRTSRPSVSSTHTRTSRSSAT